MPDSQPQPPAITIRRATAADADGIADVHVTSWREAYTGRMPPAVIAAMTYEHRRGQWRRAFEPGGWLHMGDMRCVVATTPDRVIGFTSGGPPRAKSDAVAAPQGAEELYAIYLLEAYYGSGTGRRLLDAVIPPGTPGVLWVLDGNLRAEAFYERSGFRRDENEGGTKVEEREGGAITDIRMIRT